MQGIEVIDTNADNIGQYAICGYKNAKTLGYLEKITWVKDRFREGLKLKVLYSEKDKTQGMIEYLPGEYCWRPVEASGYMFIHCIFVGFKSAYKGKGYGSLMLDECLQDARKASMHGVAVVTRKGAFMASKELFLKHGFEVVDEAPPDFELLVKRFSTGALRPKFKGSREEKLRRYAAGLTIIRADQCPYTVKNVGEIRETAEETCGIRPTVIDLRSCEEAQRSPNPFGTFCIIYQGKIVAEHPISNKRFMNIMDRR